MKTKVIATLCVVFVWGMVSRAYGQVIAGSPEDKAFQKIDDPNGDFVKGEVYVVVIDKQGVVRANGSNPKIIGVNMWEATDPDGVKFTQLSFSATDKSETAWINYKFTNPASKKIEPKRTFVHRVGDYVLQAGVYVTQ